MKARELAAKLLEHPDAEVKTCQVMHFESLAHIAAAPILHVGGCGPSLYLLPDVGLGHDIPPEVKKQWLENRRSSSQPKRED
jgi:hypothetical protein